MTEYHSFEKAREVIKDGVAVEGSFSPNGTSAVTNVIGRGFAVARTGVGEFTVTVDFPFEGLIRAAAELRMASAAGGVHQVQVGTVDVAARTIVFVHKYSVATNTTHPVAADVATGANNVFSFGLKLALSDIPGSGL